MQSMTKVRLKAVIALVSLVTATGHPVWAQQDVASYPTKPVRVVVPFPAGGVADAVTRIVAQKLGDSLDQNLVIEIERAPAARSAPRPSQNRVPTVTRS